LEKKIIKTATSLKEYSMKILHRTNSEYSKKMQIIN